MKKVRFNLLKMLRFQKKHNKKMEWGRVKKNSLWRGKYSVFYASEKKKSMKTNFSPLQKCI